MDSDVAAPAPLATTTAPAPLSSVRALAARAVATPLVAREAVLGVGYVGVVAAIAVSLALDLVPAVLAGRIEVVVAVVLVAVGTPHGALDHVAVGARLQRGVRPGRFEAGFVVGYIALAGACLAGYLAVPTVGFAAFVVLSVAHFAAGEAGVALDRGAGRRWWDVQPVTAALGGAVVLLVPLSSPAAEAAVGAVDPRLVPTVEMLALPASVAFALLAFGVVVCLVLAMRGVRGAREVAIEAALLGVLVALADPLLAFAAYYVAWHALRHQARLADAALGEGVTRDGRGRGPLAAVVRSAVPGLPATVGVLAVAIVLAVNGLSVLGALLAVVWALTVPHAVAVGLLELRNARLRASAVRPPA